MNSVLINLLIHLTKLFTFFVLSIFRINQKTGLRNDSSDSFFFFLSFLSFSVI